MRTSLTRNILEHLAECGQGMIDAFFPRYYPGTGPVRRWAGLDKHCHHKFSSDKKETISSLLSRLHREGLVTRKGSKKKTLWAATSKGRTVLKKIEQKPAGEYLVPKPDGKIRIITFDIPEKERKKRDWLRMQLMACEYELLQKSVWIGKRPLPGEFLEDLKNMQIISYVHLMSIGDKGTLSKGI